MNKRILAIIMILSVLLSVMAVSASAADSRVSNYFSARTATLAAGSKSGELALTYHIAPAVPNLTHFGISRILIYESDGTFYKTILGTTFNGLLAQSSATLSGVYTTTCEANTSYYCVVYFIAKDSAGSEAPSITTATVKTPK